MQTALTTLKKEKWQKELIIIDFLYQFKLWSRRLQKIH